MQTTVTPPALRLHKAVLMAAVLVPALVFAAAAWWNRGEVLREGTDAVQRTTAVLEEQAAKVFDTADLVLARVADQVHGMTPEEVASATTSDFLRAMKRPYDQFVSLWVSDATGRVVAGSQDWDRATLITDRDFFREQRERPETGAYISRAFTGRATSTASFAISRRRIDAEGGFAGVIHVALSPAYFAHFYAEAAPPFRHAAGLFRADGAILAREPGNPGSDQLGPESPLLRQITRGEVRGVASERSSLDGRIRIFAFRKVGTWPAFVSFGANRDALLERLHANLLVYGLVAVAAALTLLLVALLALRDAAAVQAAEAALRRETAARAAAEARQVAEARFRGVFESRAVGMSVFDLETGETLLANDRLLEMTGGTREMFETGRWDWRRATAPECRARDGQAVAEARSRGWWDPYEKAYLRPDGSRLPVRISSAPLPGEPGRVVVLVQDISEQREAEMRRDLLMREVDHRAKNALATAQAALRLTRAPDLPAFVREVDGRIGALAQALALLSTTQWRGVELEELVRGELAPFLGATGGPRAELRGPSVTIAPAAVQPLAMAIHELATNATKYGALSRPEGVLALDWALAGEAAERLRITWRERGGPRVEAPPSSKGFGARVLQATVTRQMGGRLTSHWDEAGLTCEIDLPAARVVTARSGPRAGSDGLHPVLDGNPA
ncbi:HWE histidine kinase domain-containing protein [Roseicella aquatilis]|uniref:histidine kinase n=1 Tax=Roseicella aquatilis TaxID=2527868 RepID=A0A4R4DVM7_9PROT|nr:HWE histidine kinase domain-containing protein [Roseicella aquatilis]TCZ66170.1 PAS domain S-box protein [Roseicella aquatilis]